MSLRKVHIQKMASNLAKRLGALKLLKQPEGDVVVSIINILTQNMEAERALDEEARKLLDKHRKTAGVDIDEQRAFMMVKKQLAKQKGFVL